MSFSRPFFGGGAATALRTLEGRASEAAASPPTMPAEPRSRRRFIPAGVCGVSFIEVLSSSARGPTRRSFETLVDVVDDHARIQVRGDELRLKPPRPLPGDVRCGGRAGTGQRTPARRAKATAW